MSTMTDQFPTDTAGLPEAHDPRARPSRGVAVRKNEAREAPLK